MSGLYGALGMTEADRMTRVNQIGQDIVYDAVALDLARHEADLRVITQLFIAERTSKFKRTYKLPGNGYLQQRGRFNIPGAVKAAGGWNVEWPLEDFGASIVANDIALAYMTLEELDRHIDTVILQDTNTVRKMIMTALFNNTVWPFWDETLDGGTELNVQPLANGDSTKYPQYASDVEATAQNYIVSGYVAADIDVTNNPVKTSTQKLEDYFGAPTGGSNVVMFVPRAVGNAIVEELDDFDEVPQRFIQPGDNSDVVVGLPEGTPGKVLGVVNSTWIIEWNRIPANYSLTLHMDAPPPLVMREDPPDTGIQSGLHLFYRDESKPLETSAYRHRFGIGAGNRLNGVIIQYATPGAYAIPSGFAR